MSKRFDTSGMYPGKRNPGGSPTTGRTNNTPQGKAGETPVQVPARTPYGSAGNTVPRNRFLYQEALAAQKRQSADAAANPAGADALRYSANYGAGQTPKKSANRMEEGVMKKQEPYTGGIPRKKQSQPNWNPAPKNDSVDSEEERRREEDEKARERQKQEEERIEFEKRMREQQEAYERYLEEQREKEERGERWDEFGEQFQEILGKGKNALGGEWNSFWWNLTGEDWRTYKDRVRKENEDMRSFLQDPFAAIGNFFAGEAPSTDSEYLKEAARKGAALQEILKNPFPSLANYLTASASPTDGDGLKFMAELGGENLYLNFLRYYTDVQLSGAFAVGNGLFADNKNDWLNQSRKDLMEGARENYDRMINAVPPFLQNGMKKAVEYHESLADLLKFAGIGEFPGISRFIRSYGKALDQAEKRGYSPGVQTSYALGDVIRDYFLVRTNGFVLDDNDREFLKDVGDFISKQKGIIDAVKNSDSSKLPDVLETILVNLEPGLDHVLNGTEKPNPKDIPKIFDDLVDGLLDYAEDKVEAWEKEAWEPEAPPDEIWGLPEYNEEPEEITPARANGDELEDNGWELPEEDTKNDGNRGKNWYTEKEEERQQLPQGPLPPNTTYRAGEFGYTYQTDAQGRISNWSAEDLQHTDRTERLPYVRNTPGKQPGDHAGHLAGDRFGGSGRLDNLVSQYWLVNLSSYKKLENIWDSAIRDGKTVDVDVQVEYNGDDLRPSAFSIEYTVDGEKQEKYITNDFLGGLGL